MNWGWKIAVGYSAFVLFMVYMVYLTTGVEFELVTEDYYSQELAFQGQIDKQRNAQSQGHDVEVFVESDGVALKFNNYKSGAEIGGEVAFFRPSDKTLDRRFDWKTNDKGMMFIEGDEFHRGHYIFKLDGVMDGDSFYIEKPVFIP